MNTRSDPLFANPAPALPTDPLVRLSDLLWARLRRRNPPETPRRRRNVGAWQTRRACPGPAVPSPRSHPLIFGVTAVWNEADIIYATVRNLLFQGAQKVFVIDDESDDGTPGEAAAAGAAVIRMSSSGVFSDRIRTERIRRVISKQTAEAGGDVWWIIVDADEFPRGAGGKTIRDLVGELPSWVDVVGSRVLDHMPGRSANLPPRQHPVPALPLARWYAQPYCPDGHWKHQLLRVRGADDVFPMPGHHTVGTGDGRRARESAPSLLVHHVPWRARACTEAKLRGSAAPGGRYANCQSASTRRRLAYRLQVLDDIYEGRFSSMRNDLRGQPRIGLTVRHWQDLVPESERLLPLFT